MSAERYSGPVIIRATVEDMVGTVEDWSIPRAEWDAMTPADRRAAIDQFGADTMTNCGGYGAGIWDDTAPDSDLYDVDRTPRTFGIPTCPDDLEKVVDAEGEEWTRDSRGRRGKWTSADGLEIADWRRLVVDYGPVGER